MLLRSEVSTILTFLLHDHLLSSISGSKHFQLRTFIQPRVLSRSFDSVGFGEGDGGARQGARGRNSLGFSFFLKLPGNLNVQWELNNCPRLQGLWFFFNQWLVWGFGGWWGAGVVQNSEIIGKPILCETDIKQLQTLKADFRNQIPYE